MANSSPRSLSSDSLRPRDLDRKMGDQESILRLECRLSSGEPENTNLLSQTKHSWRCRNFKNFYHFKFAVFISGLKYIL
jgi:hypothetical protein